MSTESDGVTVTMTVTLTMTPAQRDAYAQAHGVAFVGAEIANRLRPETEDALQQIRWLREYATVTITKPREHDRWEKERQQSREALEGRR